MSREDAAVTLLRGQVLGIVVGTGFVVVGLAAFVMAAARRRSGVRVLAWVGAWSALYGVQELCRSTAVVAALPSSLRGAVPFVSVTLSYLLLVVGALVWLELTRGAVRMLLVAGAAIAVAIAAAGRAVRAHGRAARPLGGEQRAGRAPAAPPGRRLALWRRSAARRGGAAGPEAPPPREQVAFGDANEPGAKLLEACERSTASSGTAGAATARGEA